MAASRSPSRRRRARTASNCPPGLLLLALALAACAPKAPSLRGANLVLITLDTLRADHVGAYGYAAAETPQLDALARQGVLFEQAMTTAPLTLPAHATLLSGLLPPRHGLRNNGVGRFPSAAPTLAVRLSAAGYRTGAFVGAFVLDHRFGLDRGFDVYDDAVPRDPAAPSAGEPERPAAAVVDAALAWLGAAAESSPPFFAWVHLYDAHAPYLPPEPFRGRHPGRPYDGEIASIDAQVGRLLAFLDQRGQSARTVVAVAGDHGEALGEHGESTHGLLLYESTLRVPLLLRAPGTVAAGRRVAEPVSLADLAPTLAGLLELPAAEPVAPEAAGDGRDLSKSLRRGEEPARADLYAETEYPATFGWSGIAALRRGAWKYIAAPRPELYDLATDRGETTNLVEQTRRERAELAARLQALRALAPLGPLAPVTTTLDAETRAQLAALGYAAAPPRPPAAGARDPKDAVALFRAHEDAHHLLRSGQAAAAAAALRVVAAQDPTNPILRNELAQALRAQGDLAAALIEYRRAAEAAPSDAQAWYELATALSDSGQLAEAAATLQVALRLQPDHAEAHNLLGVLAAGRGDLTGALAAFERAAALDPGNATAQNNLGNALRDAGKLDAARSAYQRSITLAPRYADPVNGLAVVEIQSHRPAAALPLLDRALVLAPDRHEIHLNRGIAEQTLGNREAAAAAYLRFLNAVGSDPRFAAQRDAARHLLARLRGDPSEAPR